MYEWSFLLLVFRAEEKEFKKIISIIISSCSTQSRKNETCWGQTTLITFQPRTGCRVTTPLASEKIKCGVILLRNKMRGLKTEYFFPNFVYIFKHNIIVDEPILGIRYYHDNCKEEIKDGWLHLVENIFKFLANFFIISQQFDLFSIIGWRIVLTFIYFSQVCLDWVVAQTLHL